IAFAARPHDGSLVVVSNVGLPDGPVPGTRFYAGIGFLNRLTACSEPTKIERSENEAIWLRTLGTAMIVPVRLKGSTVALFSVGAKLSGDSYDTDDREFLIALAAQTAGAVDQMRLRTLESDVQRAWEIQREFLPASLPQLAGLQLAGSCQPARVV